MLSNVSRALSNRGRAEILAVVAVTMFLGSCDRRPTGPAELGSLQALPDLVIDSVYYTTTGALDDLDTASIHVRVRNSGSTNAGSTSVKMLVDSQFEAMRLLGPLAASDDTVISFTWEAQAGEHAILFHADAPPSAVVQEANESNNTRSLSLSVSYAEREVIAQDTIVFEEIPLALRSNPLVADVLQMIADSGYSVPEGAATVFTQYTPAGTATYVTPLGSWDAAASTVPVLVIMTQPGNGSTLTLPYVFQAGDSVFTMYDRVGGITVSNAGLMITDFEQPSGPGPLMTLQSASACEEPWFWKCAKAGLMGVACVSNILAAAEVQTPKTVILAIRNCGLALSSVKRCINAVTDNPPVIKPTLQTSRRCQGCDGRDYVIWFCYGTEVEAYDDRPGGEYITAHTWTPECSGPNTFTFEVVDCGGHVTAFTAHAERVEVARIRNDPACIHNQGGTF